MPSCEHGWGAAETSKLDRLASTATRTTSRIPPTQARIRDWYREVKSETPPATWSCYGPLALAYLAVKPNIALAPIGKVFRSRQRMAGAMTGTGDVRQKMTSAQPVARTLDLLHSEGPRRNAFTTSAGTGPREESSCGIP